MELEDGAVSFVGGRVRSGVDASNDEILADGAVVETEGAADSGNVVAVLPSGQDGTHIFRPELLVWPGSGVILGGRSPSSAYAMIFSSR